GSSFSCQPHEAYNLFLTAAIGDGIKLWDLRTLRLICCSRNGELLACGLADKTLLAFKSNLIGEPTVYSGHDGAITSVGWSHDNNWLVSSSEDRTLKIWSVSSAEPALCLGKEIFHKSIRSAQFYYIDINKEYLQINTEISNGFYSGNYQPFSSERFLLFLTEITDIVLAAGSNRALEIFDLNVGCSAAVIRDAHSRSVHQICQNK
ncbi:hypothetical protein E2320_018955, partial [Naja naja]